MEQPHRLTPSELDPEQSTREEGSPFADKVLESFTMPLPKEDYGREQDNVSELPLSEMRMARAAFDSIKADPMLDAYVNTAQMSLDGLDNFIIKARIEGRDQTVLTFVNALKVIVDEKPKDAERATELNKVVKAAANELRGFS